MGAIKDVKKNDTVVFVGVPDWAVELRFPYRAAIMAHYMAAEIMGPPDIKTREVLIKSFRSMLGKHGTEEDAENIVSLLEQNGAISFN